jgi:hypothetical protein
MARIQKPIKGKGIVELKSIRTSQDGNSFVEVKTYTGPYSELKVKQDANLGAKTTHLEPTEAGMGKLSITFENQTADYNFDGRRETFTEVIWQELRKPVETNPYFAELTTDQILKVKKAIDEGGPAPSEGSTAGEIELYDLLAKGTTEWSTGVPLVRRTTTRVRGDLAGGNAWFRDAPPIDVAGSWQFLKTADERRRDGKSFTKVEEWTGAEEWDANLYP